MKILDDLRNLGYRITVNPGDVINLSYKGNSEADTIKARPLIAELKANKAGALKVLRRTYKIYSKILDEHLWIAANEAEMKKLIDEGTTEIIYTQDEVLKLKSQNLSDDAIKDIHKFKKSFRGSTIDEIEKGN